MNPILYIRTQVFRVTQQEFARIVGVGQSSVSRWEKGEDEPLAGKLARIRAAATDRGLAWDDAWLFKAPATASATGAAAA